MPTKQFALAFAQKELKRHTFDTFVDDPPSMAQGGKGVIVPGCPLCKKPIYSMTQFMEHLSVDVLPKVFDRIFAGQS